MSNDPTGRSAIPLVAHALVRGLPGYKLDDAPAITLQGRSFDPDSEAGRATARWNREDLRSLGEALDATRKDYLDQLGLSPDHPLPRGGTRQMIGWAQLYERGDAYIVVPMARTEAGYAMSVEPAQRLSIYADNRELGAAVRRAYEQPQSVVPTPDLDSDTPSVATVGAGCRSDREFMKGARMVSVWVEDGRLALAPSVRRGTSGFDFLDEEPEFEYVDDEQLGVALRAALERSR